jgi:hypothetical protein
MYYTIDKIMNKENAHTENAHTENIFYKILVPDQNHKGFQYVDGLNILDKTFQETGSCVPGGLYYTDKDNLHNFYDYGVWIRRVKIPDYAKSVEDPDKTRGRKWRSDKIILNEKYYLYAVETIIELNLTITSYYIVQLCVYGHIDVLEWLNNAGLLVDNYIEKDCVYEASKNGNVNVLEWLNNAGLIRDFLRKENLDIASVNGHRNVLEWWEAILRLKYPDSILINDITKLKITRQYILELCATGNVDMLERLNNQKLLVNYNENECLYASAENGHVNVLTWWNTSGLRLVCSRNAHIVYSENVLSMASSEGNTYILDCWIKSGLPIAYSDDIAMLASTNGHVNVLEWWFRSGLEFKYNEYAISGASSNGHVDVLEWWLKSGLLLKYDEKALDKTSANGHINVLYWWISSGLELKYTESAMIRFFDLIYIRHDHSHFKYCYLEVLYWWKFSELPLKLTPFILSYIKRACAIYLEKYPESSEVIEWWMNLKPVEDVN